ncbi:MAG TPA: DUF1837 domain-containing protein [Solirubrobacterales bacterium]
MEFFEGLGQQQPKYLEGLLDTVGEAVVLDGTKANCRCHFLARSGNGKPRVNALAKALAYQAVNFCIPRSAVIEAADHLEQTKSADKFSELEKRAQKLFTRVEKSGEGGELLLYVLLETVLQLPQLLCKMPLKTSSEMHVHGSDGVHANLLGDGTLALYWGESKLYANANAAIDNCFASIAPYLTDEGGVKATERDLLLVREHLDAGDQEATAALVRYFEDSGAESAKVEFRGACLVGFDLKDYPEPYAAEGEILDQVVKAIEKWHQRIAARIGDNKLESFEFEVFCVPMPSVKEFREAMQDRLGLKK